MDGVEGLVNGQNLMAKLWRNSFADGPLFHKLQYPIDLLSMRSGPNCCQLGNKICYIPKVSKFYAEKEYLC